MIVDKLFIMIYHSLREAFITAYFVINMILQSSNPLQNAMELLAMLALWCAVSAVLFKKALVLGPLLLHRLKNANWDTATTTSVIMLIGMIMTTPCNVLKCLFSAMILLMPSLLVNLGLKYLVPLIKGITIVGYTYGRDFVHTTSRNLKLRLLTFYLSRQSMPIRRGQTHSMPCDADVALSLEKNQPNPTNTQPIVSPTTRKTSKISFGL